MVSPIDGTLRQLEATEANLVKLERLWDEIEQLIDGNVISAPDVTLDEAHEDLCRRFRLVLGKLPAINGWSPSECLMDYNQIKLFRWDAGEVGEPGIHVSTEESIHRQGHELRAYRFEFNAFRRTLTRKAVQELARGIDECLQRLAATMASDAHTYNPSAPMSDPDWDELRSHVTQIDTLLGSSVARPPRWHDVRRHIAFGLVCDLNDIIEHDWPTVKPALERALYGDDDPLPVEIQDLSELAVSGPPGTVATKLNWERLTAQDFERLLFCIVRDAEGYENPQWLTQTNAADRGRDLSVEQVEHDPLGGFCRKRVIAACKHWLRKSVAPRDVSLLRDQMRLHQPPRVDRLIIATSGRFTDDAVALIEKHNQEDRALHIDMWPESHLEHLLAERPHLVAEFGLK